MVEFCGEFFSVVMAYRALDWASDSVRGRILFHREISVRLGLSICLEVF